jgi:hypothetical protein
MENWRDKLCSTKNVKILEDQSDDSDEKGIDLEMYEKAHAYFFDQNVLTEIRLDISGRFGYLEYFMHKKGNISRSEPDDYCCKTVTQDYDDLMIIIAATGLKRNKYAHEWNCENKIDITQFQNELELREWIISGRCRTCQHHAFKNKSLQPYQGNIIYDNFIAHNIQGKSSNISYDLFYTYITRITKIEQCEICNDRSCPCIPKNLKPEDEFKININVDKIKEAGRNDLCECGSGKKYKKCCLEKSPKKEFPESVSQNKVSVKKLHKKQNRNDLCACGSGKKYKKCCLKNMDEKVINSLNNQAAITNHMLQQMQPAEADNGTENTIDNFMNTGENGIFKIKTSI